MTMRDELLQAMQASDVYPKPPSMASGLLHELIGRKLEKMVRYSWWPADVALAECGIVAEQAFSLTAGPVAIHFEDGFVLGAASHPSWNSVVVWNEGDTPSNDKLESDAEFHPITSSGRYATAFWQRCMNEPVVEVIILKRVKMSAKARALPSEVGVRLLFGNGLSFVLSHGLNKPTDDFSILEEFQLQPDEFSEVAVR